jgi:hypothetical protein
MTDNRSGLSARTANGRRLSAGGRRRDRRRFRAVAARVARPAAIPLAALQAAKKLAQELGGVEKAKQAINSLSRLMD